MSPFSFRHLTVEERIFYYKLKRTRLLVVKAFGILANLFRCLLTNKQQQPAVVASVTLSCVCLHYPMRIKYQGLKNALLDRERDDHKVVPGALRDEAVFQNARNVTLPNSATR